jgi:hypothetical protein
MAGGKAIAEEFGMRLGSMEVSEVLTAFSTWAPSLLVASMEGLGENSRSSNAETPSS